MTTLAVDQLQSNGQAAGIPRDLIWRLTPDQYHRMIDQGILTDADPVELLEGWLVQKMPKKPMHRLVTRRTRKALEKVVGDDWYVDCQEPITTRASKSTRNPPDQRRGRPTARARITTLATRCRWF
ncbi:MAG: class II D-tagatose-bisphosphate aldolase, non-catalytic subunit [Gemmataceae bacterium]|nr:class II D-tagatose-bisphosphate aldolase, non-catalytic subunit [Gemmataceae bacterium]MCI0741798.1 class II D-tagatose-bisphosphate aldolase, non-catalytic subunit [Gemmataceae bacterium]